MDGWMHGWMGGWIGGCMDGWMGGYFLVRLKKDLLAIPGNTK
jgi:hypothetical protein